MPPHTAFGMRTSNIHRPFLRSNVLEIFHFHATMVPATSSQHIYLAKYSILIRARRHRTSFSVQSQQIQKRANRSRTTFPDIIPRSIVPATFPDTTLRFKYSPNIITQKRCLDITNKQIPQYWFVEYVTVGCGWGRERQVKHLCTSARHYFVSALSCIGTLLPGMDTPTGTIPATMCLLDV